jgi:site-specific DNA-methyltransferase (adenine-specific)
MIEAAVKCRSEVFLMDCIEGMKQYPDKLFDLAVVDPPYFSDYAKETYPGAKISTTGIKRHRFHSKHWELPTQVYFDELYRVSKNQIVWGINYYEKYAKSVGRIVWDKVNDKSSFSKAEIAMCSFGISVQMFRFMWNGMLQGDMKNKEIKIHSCQKPVALYDWIFKNYATEGMKILDTHLGSGSSRIAADKAGLNFTGFEIDEEYFNASEKRYNDYKKQTRLF